MLHSILGNEILSKLSYMISLTTFVSACIRESKHVAAATLPLLQTSPSTMDSYVDLLPRETTGHVSADLILLLNNSVATGECKSYILCCVSFIKEILGAKTQNWLARPSMYISN